MTIKMIITLICYYLTLTSIFTAGILVPPDLKYKKNYIHAVPGDINFGYLGDIHSPGKTSGTCLDTVSSKECATMAAASMVIDYINKRQDLLPNLTLGLITVDACFNYLRALEVVMPFVKEANRSSCNINSDQTDIITYDIVGIIGPALTQTAMMASPLMGIYEIPMMGLYATSDQLSDKVMYPYYTRLVAPDSVVVQGLLDIAESFHWSYVTVLYAEGSFGENAASQIDRLIRKSYYMCVAIALKVPFDATDDEYELITQVLLRNRKARIVLAFITPTDLGEILTRVNNLVGPGVFLWMSSNTLLQVPLSAPYIAALEGSIFLDHINDPIPGFDDYMHSTAMWDERNVWLIESWEKNFNCVMPPADGNINSITNATICAFDPNKVDQICKFDGWVARSRIFDSAMVMATALQSLLQDNCLGVFQDKTLFKTCFRGDLFLSYIHNISYDGLIGNIKFTSDGNVVENFAIKQFQKNISSGLYYRQDIGRWNQIGGLRLFQENIQWDVFSRETEAETNETMINFINAKPNKSGVLESLCSLPCLPGEYIISQTNKCCWVCARCRDNERVSSNRTSCETCPLNFWPDPINASTCEPIAPTYLEITSPMSAVIILTSCLGILLSVMVIFVYIFYGHHKLVMATSRQLCLIILTGTTLTSISVIYFVLRPSRPQVCSVRQVGFHLSINLVYAPLLVKNIRIYRVFTDALRGNQRTPFSNNSWQLFFTGAIISIQITILAAVESLYPSLSTLRMPSSFEPYVELLCDLKPLPFLLPLSFNILLIIICTLIGFFTRKLPDNFNESWFIFVSATTTLFSWAVFIPAYFVTVRAYLQSAILGFCLALNCFITIGCLFGPVLYAVAFVPNERIKFSIGLVTKSAVSHGSGTNQSNQSGNR